LGATGWWFVMVGEGEGRVNQEICLILHVDVYRCGVKDDVGGSDSQQDNMSEHRLKVLLITSYGGEKKQMGERRIFSKTLCVVLM